MGRRFLICLILVAVTLVTYGQVIEFEFVDCALESLLTILSEA